MQKIKISKNITVSPNSSIREVMTKLSVSNYNFQLVVQNKTLLGTVVDGDIRRAILKGQSIDEDISLCMNKKPIVGKEKNENKFKALIESIPSDTRFLPVLNKEKKILFVIINKNNVNITYYLIMAGGYGKRLGDKTKKTPKPLLKIKKKPILEDILKKVETTKYKKIYLSTHYLHNKIEHYINKRKNKTTIQLLKEKKPLGTAGSIHFLKNEEFDNLVVINGDIITDVDLDSLKAYHNASDNDITITVTNFTYSVPFGLVKFDKNLSFLSLEEKPNISHFVLSGIYCLNKEVCNLVKNENIDMTDIIQKAYLLKKKIGIFPISEYWKDIGNLKDFKAEIKRNKKLR